MTTTVYDVYFSGDRIKTTVTNSPDSVVDWICDIESDYSRHLHHLIVGLDIEWRPTFSVHQNPVATLQLCVGRRCLTLQLLHCSHIPLVFSDNFLCNPNYTFVGVGINGDVEKLERDYGITVGNAVDLRDLAVDAYGMRELKSAGLKKLCDVVLGKEIEKPRHITMGRWDKEWLDEDAFVSFEIEDSGVSPRWVQYIKSKYAKKQIKQRLIN